MVPSKSNQQSNTTVSIVVPAFNEEQNLAATVESIRKAIEGKFSEYEIIIVNDGSKDGTGKLAESLTLQYPHLRVVHNPHNIGYGFTVMRGAREAKFEYVQLVPGDNEIPTHSIEAIANKIGTADLVIPYMINFRIRTFKRKAVSWVFTTLLNVSFAMRLHYYNGPCAMRTNLIKTVKVNTRGFAFMACILIQLIKRRHSFVEVGILLETRKFGKSTMLSAKNIASVLKTIAWLFWNINVSKRLIKTRYIASQASSIEGILKE